MKNMNKNNSFLSYIVAFLIGTVISVMVLFNTKLGNLTTNEVSICVNQIVGIIALTLIMTIGRKNTTINPKREKSVWWQWFGGLFGLAILSINYYSVSYAGATIAMATAVLGQCLAGAVMDATGWMGIKKQALSRKKILSLLISLVGILLMIFYPRKGTTAKSILFGLSGICAGILTMIQMVYNSNFAKKKGAFFSARQNVISGLFGIALFMIVFKRSASIEGFKALSSVPFLIIIMGGLLANFVVVGTNTIIHKIPAADSSILMSSGQIITAVLIDALVISNFDMPLLFGAILMVLGIVLGR